MRIDISALILFSFYKSYVKQTFKYYNLIFGTIIRPEPDANKDLIRPDAGSESVSCASLIFKVFYYVYSIFRKPTPMSSIVVETFSRIKSYIQSKNNIMDLN